MGTNYYLRKNACPMCGHSDDLWHIGKSATGWHFSLHVDPAEGVNNITDLKRLLKTGRIYDEYDNEITIAKMLDIITNRRGKPDKFDDKPYGYDDWGAFHAENGSEQGKSGLLRHKIGYYCVGHGRGTYDYIQGWFS